VWKALFSLTPDLICTRVGFPVQFSEAVHRSSPVSVYEFMEYHLAFLHEAPWKPQCNPFLGLGRLGSLNPVTAKKPDKSTIPRKLNHMEMLSGRLISLVC
jgi:hypothetical protein